MPKNSAPAPSRGLATEIMVSKVGSTIGGALGFMTKVALGTIVAIAVARAMGVSV